MAEHDLERLPKSIDAASRAQPSTQIQISVLTVVKVVLALVGLYIIYRLVDVIVMFFVALLLAALIDPFADWFQKRKIPRALAVLAIYIILFGILGLAIVLLVPPLLSELSELVRNFSGIWGSIATAFVSVQEISAEYGVAENIERGLRSLETGLYD
ncbi:AI-2E family transporter, partial [Candidatus Uhrbacteria bacterium]|nr:AI-2E family transporter [Candidatus Uhrbacteria bacterium]